MRGSRTQWQALRVLRRRAWILLVCVVVAGAVAFGLAHHAQKKYSATASLLFGAANFDQQLFGQSLQPEVLDPTRQAQTELNLVTLPIVAARTAAALGPPSTTGSIQSAIAAAPSGDSDLVSVTATEPDPKMAARVANLYATEFVAYREGAERANALQSALQVERQVAGLRRTAPASPEVKQLQQRASQLQTLAAVQSGDVTVAQPASAPTAPSSPSVKKDTALGIIIGLIIGGLGMILAERLDRALVDEEDAEAVFELSTVSTVPIRPSLERGTPRSPSAPEMEIFRLMRARLRYFDVDRDIKSILVASAAPLDGKSTIAFHLARAAAEVSPGSPIVLVEADLRRPTLAMASGVASAPGLSEVLSRAATLDEVIQQVPVSQGGVNNHATLNLITSGALPPNPTELMGSKRLQDVLEELETQFDLVIIDAPPTSFVSDAMPLLGRVGGVLVVTRLRNTPRDAARLLRDQLRDSGAHTLGLVLNGVKTSGPAYYASQSEIGGTVTPPRTPMAPAEH